MVLYKFAIVVVVVFLTIFFTSHVFARDINLVFGGDATFGGHYASIAKESVRDPAWSFRNIKNILESADLVMVNCENAITEADKKAPKKFNFKMRPEQTEIFKHNNIGLVTIANNHVYDYGKEGLLDTIANLDKFGIEHVGAGANLEQARIPVEKIINGKRLFFLAYGNYSPATAISPGVVYRNPAYVIEDIRRAKANGSDLVIINFHWGVERSTCPTKGDQSLAHLAIDSGADIIIGHHPHVIQPVEIYKKKIIAYSLENFIFGGNSNGPKEGMLIKVKISPENALSYEKIILSINPKITRYQPKIKEIK